MDVGDRISIRKEPRRSRGWKILDQGFVRSKEVWRSRCYRKRVDSSIRPQLEYLSQPLRLPNGPECAARCPQYRA